MSGRITRCTAHQREPFADGWEMAGAGLSAAQNAWLPAQVPGTVAASLAHHGQWSIESAARNFDAEEWVYRRRFAGSPAGPDERVILGFDGLATICDVSLNGTAILSSDNMFIAHRCDVGGLLKDENELVMRFRPLETALQSRRPRPRWRAPMVRHQQLRWHRTTLLGRTPGWSPPVPAVGPWRGVWLERRRLVEVESVRLRASVDGGTGRVAFSCEAVELGGAALSGALLRVERNGHIIAVPLVPARTAPHLSGIAEIPNVELWWPHTHGEAALYGVSVQLSLRDRCGADCEPVIVDLGKVGFRELRLDRSEGRFALSVNRVPLFCRGAAWTPPDCVSLQASGSDYDAVLRDVVAAGMNMVRIAGPMVYETDEFLDLCDSLGILVWQDFMFANMDYPLDDARFAASVEREVRQQLGRLQARPAIAVLCGNSEISQQAAMFGAARALWNPAWFETGLAGIVGEYCAEVPYCPSSTHGGAFPHQASAGVSSYYGVGAYLRDFADARRSQVRFASECLAFANVPEEETLAALQADGALRCHHPRWKERVPRDLGAGWDFDDVRDHYVARLFGADPARLRYEDHDRYLRLGRVASGEAMAACFTEWRRARSSCAGGLIWFLRDLWPGAGWGLIDSTGLPKAAYYLVRRALQPISLSVTDEGTNGLAIHVVNDRARDLAANLEIRLFKHSAAVGQVVAAPIVVRARGAGEVAPTDLFENFLDLSHAYRFGPPAYDLMHVRLLGVPDGRQLAETFFHPIGLANRPDTGIGLSAQACPLPHGRFELRVHARRYAQSVHIEARGFIADDQYFHLAPDSARLLTLRPRSGRPQGELTGAVHALNAANPVPIVVPA